MTLEERVGRLLAAQKKTLAVAESCTGGLLGAHITRVAGSSDYFWGGWLTYDNRAKRQLGVRQATLDRYGAVSAPCAREMAKFARQRAKTTYALAVTGIAGPAGGTDDKPVGLAFIALAAPGRTVVRKKRFLGNRRAVREGTVRLALETLRRELTNSASRTSRAR